MCKSNKMILFDNGTNVIKMNVKEEKCGIWKQMLNIGEHVKNVDGNNVEDDYRTLLLWLPGDCTARSSSY